MNTSISTPRRRGRPPAAGEAQRQNLLHAAQELLATTHVPDLNLRMVALRAGVTPPLAHYYFRNREGLLAALLEERAAPHMEAALTAAPEHANQPVAALTRLMQRLTQLLAADDFLRRCLLWPGTNPLRERLRERIGGLLQAAQAAGQLRADLPRDYLGNALLGLCLFPFMDSGAAHDAAGHAAALTLQHAALLQDGILQRKPRA